MKILITGRSGVGKSTVVRELQKRGYTVHDTDDMPEVSRLEVKATGEPVEWPKGYVDWDYYAWRWQKEPIEKLLASDEDVIVGAIMSNQMDFYHLFDLIIVLTISPAALRKRLETRTAHAYNNDQRHIERSAKRHEKSQTKLLMDGVVAIDNNRRVEIVADDIIKLIETSHATLAKNRE